MSAARAAVTAAALVGVLVLRVGTDYVPGATVQEHVDEEEHKGAPWLDSNVPKFVEPLRNVTVPVGRDAVLTCVVDNLSTYRVAWLQVETQTILTVQTAVITKNHRVALTHTDQRIWYLHIKDVQEKDRGPYMCQINTDPMKSQVGYLEVVVPPDIWDMKTSTDVVAQDGADVSLSCAATGYPAPTISWRREGGATIVRRGSGEEVKQVEGGRLNITNVTRHHMGAYLCIASNGVPPTVSKRIMLKVNYAPIVTVAKSSVPAVVGDHATLECFVDAFPKPVGYWTLPNNTSFSQQVLENTAKENHVILTLNITRVRKEDYGTYKCFAKNPSGIAEGVVRLYEIKPTTTVPPPTTTTTSTTTTTTTTTPPPRQTAPPQDRRKSSHSDKDLLDGRQEKRRKGGEVPENSVTSSKNSREASTRGASRPASSASSATASSASLRARGLAVLLLAAAHLAHRC